MKKPIIIIGYLSGILGCAFILITVFIDIAVFYVLSAFCYLILAVVQGANLYKILKDEKMN